MKKETKTKKHSQSMVVRLIGQRLIGALKREMENIETEIEEIKNHNCE